MTSFVIALPKISPSLWTMQLESQCILLLASNKLRFILSLVIKRSSDRFGEEIQPSGQETTCRDDDRPWPRPNSHPRGVSASWRCQSGAAVSVGDLSSGRQYTAKIRMPGEGPGTGLQTRRWGAAGARWEPKCWAGCQDSQVGSKAWHVHQSSGTILWPDTECVNCVSPRKPSQFPLPYLLFLLL